MFGPRPAVSAALVDAFVTETAGDDENALAAMQSIVARYHVVPPGPGRTTCRAALLDVAERRVTPSAADVTTPAHLLNKTVLLDLAAIVERLPEAAAARAYAFIVQHASDLAFYAL